MKPNHTNWASGRMEDGKKEPLRFLVIAGHPADSFDHCGGTLAHHVRRGDEVTCLILTHGLRVHDAVLAEELRLQIETPDLAKLVKLLQERGKIKHQEVVDACGMLGVTDIRFLDYDDSILLVTNQMVEEMAKVIRDVKPHVIITHWPLENAGIANHHATTGQIALHAVSCAANFDPNDPNPGWRIAQIFFMAPVDCSFKYTCLGAESSLYCNYYVDITDVIELKVKAWAKMASQNYSGDYARKSAERWNGKDGHFMGVPYAEAFVQCYPEIGKYLLVSDERLEWANEQEIERRKRADVMIAPFVKLPGDKV